MLCLNRKVDEEITIDGGITIKVIKIRGDRVTLGIDAPTHLRVNRREVTYEPRSNSSLNAKGGSDG